MYTNNLYHQLTPPPNNYDPHTPLSINRGYVHAVYTFLGPKIRGIHCPIYLHVILLYPNDHAYVCNIMHTLVDTSFKIISDFFMLIKF